MKPSNILLNSNGEAKLCDFGSAKILKEGEKSIPYICSRYYRAAELVLGAESYTLAVDMWSLGCILCEMLINQPIFPGINNTDMLLQMVKVLGTPTQ